MSYFLGVDTGSSRAVITKELGWMEYSSSLAIGSGLLHCYPDVETIIKSRRLGQLSPVNDRVLEEGK